MTDDRTVHHGDTENPEAGQVVTDDPMTNDSRAVHYEDAERTKVVEELHHEGTKITKAGQGKMTDDR